MKSDEGKKKVLDALAELSPAIAKRSAEIEAARRLPLDLLGQLKEAGLFRMFVPSRYGGLGVDLVGGLEILEALARADGSTGWTTMIGSETAHLLSFMRKDRFDALYAQHGPDLIVGGTFNPSGEAKVVEGGYQVTGRWPFASGCEHADYLFGNCVVTENGQPRPGAEPGVPQMRCTLFRNKKDVRIHDTWSVLGLRGTGSHDISVEGLFVPEEDTFDIFGPSSLAADPHFAAPFFNFMLNMGAVVNGIAQGAIDDMVAIAKGGKRRMYARAPVTESQLFRHQLGEAEVNLRASRAGLRVVAQEVMAAGVDAPATLPTLIPRASGMLVHNTDVALKLVNTFYRAGGASSLRDGSSLQRRFRDAHAFSQHASAAEGWHAQYGGSLLGLPSGYWT
jgi:alkylation response protein AidB-like acyl-CoA dehydrogenase